LRPAQPVILQSASNREADERTAVTSIANSFTQPGKLERRIKLAASGFVFVLGAVLMLA